MKRSWTLKALATPVLAFGLFGAMGNAQTTNPNDTTNPTYPTSPNYSGNPNSGNSNYAGRSDDYTGRTNGGGSRWGLLGLFGLLGLLGARRSHTHGTTTRPYDRTESYEPRPTR